MGELPDGTWVPDEPPHRGAHPQGWMDLTPQQRVIHYNRNLPGGCDHRADLEFWPEALREAWSFDPYAHVAHIDLCFKSAGDCDCQTCEGNFGIWRG